MLLDKARYKFKLFLFALLAALVHNQVPGVGQLGGSTTCSSISGCQQSLYCDLRCAPVNASLNGPGILRWCNQNNTNYGCCCGCTDNTTDYGNVTNYFWYVYDNYTCASSCPGGYYPPTGYDRGYAC